MVRATHVPSRYLAFGERTFQHRTGRPVRAVYHTATASALLLDPSIVDVLSGAAPLDRLDAASLDRLAQLGLLVPAGTDEAGAVIAVSRAAVRDARQRQFVVMPTAYCNMGCDYCGQEHRRGSGIAPGRHRDALVERAERAMAGGRYDAVHVRWFGGEPLMGYAVMRALSARFVADAQRHGVTYSAKLVTNGALLDARKLRALHLECRVKQIEVTIDGPPARHEASRPLKSGQQSYARIVTAIGAALSDPDLAGLSFSVRTNVGQHNADLAGEFAAGMAAAGLAHPRVSFYPAPIHSWGNDVSDVALERAEQARVELDWYTAYLAAGLTCALLPATTRPVVCTAVTAHSEVVAPDGRVYSCTEQPLVPGFTEQHVGDLTALDPAEPRPAGAFDDWYDSIDRDRTGCGDCRLLPVCGGACPKLWREGKPPCPPLKTNLTQRLDLFAGSTGLTPLS
ncbi:radical SAM/SPASM domain-containing protein [Catellatospora methionotrophica]|uniref:Radical SAM/SPASM domain-containing protein n=1 Tax=Catellatospora methionotrophica TaxID=121620 RepID=A0A8J3LAW3_9ACTN|nr:radical SAM protein [Catellatospora methionotrophica]GIG14984.1 radical SAM/SPASM domain-containing protein [Catellatospora methionotrophica]